MNHDVAETCTCGTPLTVRGSFQAQPITHCAHCDVPIEHQTDHLSKLLPCTRCYRYDHHVLRYPDWRSA